MIQPDIAGIHFWVPRLPRCFDVLHGEGPEDEDLGLPPKLADLQRKWLSAERAALIVLIISSDADLAFCQTRPKSSEREAMFVAKLKDVHPIHRIGVIAWPSQGMAIHPFPPFQARPCTASAGHACWELSKS